MRFLILIPLFSLVYSAPQPMQDEEELPFSTDNFNTFLDEANSSSGEEKDELALSYNEQAETLKKRLKMKSMFNTNGPPSIGTDLFSSAAVEENVKKLSYEGSGSAIEANQEKSEEITTTSDLYSADNSTVEDSAVEASSNSSLVYDQNTSDAEVEMISDAFYQKNDANVVLQASEIEDEGEENDAKLATVSAMGDYSGNDTTTSKAPCPPPKMCARNCFVTINEEGCQDCQCLWIADNCDTDKDCTHRHQFCDLGKCNCEPGYQQNMRKSGVCEIDPESRKKMNGVFPETEESEELDTNNISKESRRRRRSAKPRRSERLEWPGVCDKNEQCPDNLVCIHGDCWSIPDKMKRLAPTTKPAEMIISRNTEDENMRRVSFDTDEIMEPTSPPLLLPIATTTEMFLPVHTTEAPRRGLSRFVSEDFAKQLKRTTAKVKKYDWFPPTTTATSPTTNFPMTTNNLPPLTVDQFFMIETTVPPPIMIKPFLPPPPIIPQPPKKIFNDHKMEYMKERKPNFLGVKEEVHEIDYPSSQSHIKKIHLEMQPTLLPHRRKHKKLRTTTTVPDDASEVEDASKIDEVEFPISSKIQKGAHKPRALSAEPTREELKDHKSLVELFNAHASTDAEPETELPPIKPSFQILKSFSDGDSELGTELNAEIVSESEQAIQMSLVTDNPTTKFSPIPDLSNGDFPTRRKPYIIQKMSFTTISPLSDISGDMATEDPPEVTPEPAPFEQHQMGVWYPMKKGDIPHLGIFTGEFRRSPRKRLRTADDLRLYNEYTKANRQNRPIRIEMDNASSYVRNECRNDKNCGNKTKCCLKKWCDRTNICGVGKFCLPSCDSTKLTFLPSSSHAESVIDIMYD